MSKWWDRGTPLPLEDTNFQKIINFYLFNCPCEIESGSVNKETKTYTKVSQRGITLRSKGWVKGFLNTLLASMKKTTSGHLEYHPFSVETNISIESSRIESNVGLSDMNFEMVVFVERRDMNKTSAIFYYIRNALAHGSFSVVSVGNRKIYYLESAKNSTIKARIRLNEETLLKWIKDVELSPNALRNVLKEDAKNKRKRKKEAA